MARRLVFRGQPRLAALLGQQPCVAVAAEDDIGQEVAHAVDHRRTPAGVQRGDATAEERPGEGNVAPAVAGDEADRAAHDLVPGLLQMTQLEIQVELVVERTQRGDVGLHGNVRVKRRLRERMIAGVRQAGVARIGLVAAQPLGQHVADLQVLGLLGGTEGQEELGVHAERSRLQAEADQQRGALGQAGIDAPGPPAPGPARRLERRLGVAGGVEPVPRDVRFGIPVQPLGLAVQLAERRHLGRKLKREPTLDEPLLLRLVGAQQPRRVLARLAHRGDDTSRLASARSPSTRRPTGTLAVAFGL
jgi:hypothetical protein